MPENLYMKKDNFKFWSNKENGNLSIFKVFKEYKLKNSYLLEYKDDDSITYKLDFSFHLSD